MSDPRIENARQLMAAGKLDEAMGVLKAALKDDPANADVKALLVEIQERLMLQLQIDEKMKRVHLLLKEGFKENAQTLLEEILKIDGQNREASELLQQLKTGGEAPAKPLEAPAPPAESPPAAGVDSEELPFGPPQPFDDSQAFPEGGPKLDESEPSPFDDLDESGDENVFELESAPAAGVEDTQSTPPPLEIPLEPLTESENAAPGTSLSPQEKDKVDGYIAEGKALFDQGRYQEAIDTWSRVFIVDEESREAQDLIDKAKAGLEQSQGEWQTSLTEGIAAYTAGDLAKAEGLFQKVLERFPENSEAQYYLSRIRGQGVPASVPAAPAEAPPGPSPAAPAQTGSETPPEPSGFEFEDDAPAPGKFEFESGTPEPPKAEAPPAPPGPVPSQPPPPPPGRFEQTEGGDEEFVLERGGEDATPPDAPAGSGSSPRPREDSSWDDIAPPPPGFGAESGQGAAAPGPPPPPPPAPGSEAGGAAMPPGKKPAVRKKVIGVGVGIAAVAVIAVIGAVIFWLTFSSNSGAGTAPSVPVSSVGRHKPKIKPKPKPKAPAPSAEQNPNGAQAEPAQPKPMTVDELLAAGKAAEGKKDYRKAAELYREALAKDALNTKAQNALASAQEAYEKQQEEARRNKAFLEKYQKSTQAFQDKDWADCLRQAWRLIYPDDTLASQLGKRKSIHDLIRDGYYNWAVQDLKAQNIQGAVKHLNDLLEFDGSDGQAKKLKAFTERYTKMPPDDIYADTVQALTYRTLPEEP